MQSGSGSVRRRPAPRTSVWSAPRCSTGPTPGTPAARSSSASRTPTPQRDSEESYAAILDALRWLGLDWDEGPEVGGPYEPYRQSQRGEIYRDVVARLLAAGEVYEAYSTAEEVEARHVAAGRNPKLGYDNYDRDLTDGAACRSSSPRAASRCCGCGCPTRTSRWNDLVRGPTTFAAGIGARLRDHPRQRRSVVHVGQSGRRRADEDHPRAARRGHPAVDAASDRAVPGADPHRRRRRDPRVRPSAKRSRRRQQEAVQARPAVEPVPAPRPRLHPRGPAELPGAAGLGDRRRPRRVQPRRDGGRLRRRRRQLQPGPLRPEEGRRDQRRAHPVA